MGKAAKFVVQPDDVVPLGDQLGGVVEIADPLARNGEDDAVAHELRTGAGADRSEFRH